MGPNTKAIEGAVAKRLPETLLKPPGDLLEPLGTLPEPPGSFLEPPESLLEPMTLGGMLREPHFLHGKTKV